MLSLHIASNYGPFTQLNNEHFEKFLCDFVGADEVSLPCPQTFTNRLQELSVGTDEETIQILQNLVTNNIIIVIDAWDNSVGKEHVYAFMIYYVSNDWEYKKRLQELSTLNANTGDEIVNYFRDTIVPKFLQHAEGKSFHIVSDHGPEIMRAQRLLIEAGDVAGGSGCACHFLHLSVVNMIYDVDETKRVFKTVKEIVKFFNQSSRAYTRLNEEQARRERSERKLIQSTKVRWLSFYKMIARFLEEYECIVAVYGLLHKPFPLSEVDINGLRELNKLLKVMSLVSERLQGDSYTTCSVILPLFRGLLNHLNNIQNTLVYPNNQESLHIFIDKFNWRENLLVSAETQRRLSICTALDIRFKHLRHLHLGEKQYVRNKLTEELHQLNEPGEPEASQGEIPEIDIDQLLLLGEEENAFTIEYDELNNWFNEPHADEDPIVWWKANQLRYPNLSKIALYYLSFPATSAIIERLFSLAGRYHTKNRPTLSTKNLSSSLKVNVNK